jgi:peptide/nickel transport system ATP-binding protein
MGGAMLEVRNLSIAFKTRNGLRSSVRNIDFTIKPGEILGLVGESGSGKTITSLAVMGLLPPNAVVTSGQVLVDGTDMLQLGPADLRALRGKHVAMVFQDPMASLDPIFTCGDQIIETIRLHEAVSKARARQRAIDLLEKVRIPDPARAMRAYPHELSGGQHHDRHGNCLQTSHHHCRRANHGARCNCPKAGSRTSAQSQ